MNSSPYSQRFSCSMMVMTLRLTILLIICNVPYGSFTDANFGYAIGPNTAYQSNGNYAITLETDVQPLVDAEILHLKFRTKLEENSVVAVGRTNEYSFKIELVDGRLVFHFSDSSDLSISSYALPSKQLNDGNWHRLVVQRTKSKFEVNIDGSKYSEIAFNKPLTENVFAGSRIILGFNNEFNRMIRFDGEIAEVITSANNVPLPIKEVPVPLSEMDDITFPEQLNEVDKVIIRVDMAPVASIALRPEAKPLTLLYNEEKHVDSFGFSFRSSSVDGIIASLYGTKSRNFVGFEIVGQTLFLIVHSDAGFSSAPQRRQQLGRTDRNSEHTVHLRNDRQGDVAVVSAWLTSNRQNPVSFKVSDPFRIDRISFGASQQDRFASSQAIAGCVSKPYLNLFTLDLKSLLPAGLTGCSLHDNHWQSESQRRFVDHVEAITFRHGDRPLPFTYAENDGRNFSTLQLEFATLESSGIIASLHDNKDNFLALFIRNGKLFLIIDDKYIEQQSFMVSDISINDGHYHKIRIVNAAPPHMKYNDLSGRSKQSTMLNSGEFNFIDVDSRRVRFPKPLVNDFHVMTIYFAAADFWAKDHYSLGSIGNFLGCMRNILFNEEHIIRYDHVLDKSRINAGCQATVAKPAPVVRYLPAEVSFSCRKPQDSIAVKLTNSEEFNSLAVPIATIITEGVIVSLSSSFEKKAIVLYVQNGGLNLAYIDDGGKELHLTTGKLINDGQQYRIYLKRELVPGRIALAVNDQTYNVDIPIGTSPLFFDKLTIGGPNNAMRFITPTQQSSGYGGCFQQIEYNKASIVPNSVIPDSRRQCSVQNGAVCDQANGHCRLESLARRKSIDDHDNMENSNVIPQFCPSRECSLFCQSNDQSKVRVSLSLEPSLKQAVSLVLRTNHQNSKISRLNSITGISMALSSKEGYPMLEISNNGRLVTLEFPKQQISDARHHNISIHRNQNEINLSIDDITVTYNLKSFLRKKLTFDDYEICTGLYRGYIQDVALSTENDRPINLINEIVKNPSMASIGPAAVWENRYPFRRTVRSIEDDTGDTCLHMRCNNGQVGCRRRHEKRGDTLHISIPTGHQANNRVCVCVDASEAETNPNCVESSQDLCSRHECVHGDCVVQNQVAVCRCSDGYTGERCEYPYNPCSQMPCQNGGTCYGQGTSNFVCFCTSGFTGRYCEQPVRLDPCQHIVCRNGGYCYNGQCQCPTGYFGQYCEEERQDSCLSIRCQNGGHCVQGKCQCPIEFSGDFCEHKIDICDRMHCQNGGQCSYGVCHCPQWFTGTYCEIKDPCHGINCQNSGVCENGVCRCHPAFSGQYCQTRDACYEITCSHGGQCIDGKCICPKGRYGSSCQHMEVSDPCTGKICQNGGACQDGHCRCPLGYFGDLCEQRDNCHDVDCHDGGYCVDGYCVCSTGYYGDFCESLDICHSVTCLNSGRCQEGSCICPPGFGGPTCEQSIGSCQGINCGHGHCQSGQCICDDGYEGTFCDILVPISAGWGTRGPIEGGLIDYGRVPRSRGKHLGAIFAIASGLALGALAGAFAARKCAEGACGPGGAGAAAVTTIPVINEESIHPVATMMERTVPTVFASTDSASSVAMSKGHRADIEQRELLLPSTRTMDDGMHGSAAAGQTERIETVHERTVETNFGNSSQGPFPTAFYTGRSFVPQNAVIFAPAVYAGTTGNQGAPILAYSNDFYSPWPQSEYNKNAQEAERLIEAQMFDDSPYMQSTTSTAIGGGTVVGGGAANFAYHPPPINDFGYGTSSNQLPSQQVVGYSEGESWEAGGTNASYMGGALGMNNLNIGSSGGPVTNGSATGVGIAGVDYELSNINTLTMTPNGKYAIVGQSQGPPQIWDAQNGNLINSLFGNCNNCVQLELACSGTLLVGLSSDATDTQPCVVQIWDINTGRPIHLSHQIKCAAFTLSNNTNNIVMAGNQKYGRGISVGILDLVSNELTKELKSDAQTNLGRDPGFIALTPNECHAVIGCFNRSQGMTNYVVFDLTVNTDVVQPPSISLDCDPKRCVVLSNKECISGLSNGQFFIWDLSTCKPIHYFMDPNLDRVAHRGQINDLQISNDRSLIITASKDGTAKIWDTIGRNLLTRLLGHHAEVTCACLSSNQQLAVTGSVDQTICLWRLPSGQLAAQMNVGMIPSQVKLASENRTVVSIAEKDNERQLLMLRVVSSPPLQSTPQR